MTLLKVMIIDDEPDAVNLLKLQIARHCPQIGAVGAYTSPVKALAEMDIFKPDLVFLDIEMPVMNGFELLQQLMPLEFGVVFITAYNQFALRAFKFNALDYLVKPVDTSELKEAVAKAERNNKPSELQISQLNKLMRGEKVTKIAVSSQNSISFIELNEIIYAEANNNYSRLVLTDGATVTVSKTLKDVQDLLEESHFLRIHRQYVVNLNQIKHFNRNDYLLTMVNKAELPVARNLKDKLIESFGVL